MRLGTSLLAATAVLLAAARARSWTASSGSTPQDRVRDLPGDDLVRDPLMCVTRSIAIDAPASAVWPWIAQIRAADLGRAGWYSYDRLDNGGVPLVLDIRPPGKVQMHATFASVVDPVDDEHSRLVERSWWDMRPRWAGRPFSLAFEPIDFVMMRKHLLTVRDRAEAAYRG